MAITNTDPVPTEGVVGVTAGSSEKQTLGALDPEKNGDASAVGAQDLVEAVLEAPPDGGTRAWLQVLGGHFVIFNSWGYINSFGVFQSTYVSLLNETPSAISWIGSVQIFLLFMIGTWTGRALDIGYFRYVLITGSVLQVFSVLMTSFCTQYWQLFLAQGIGNGLANGFMFCPTVALVSTYFHRNRALAIGIVASGSATGGIVIPLVVSHLLPKVGYAWTLRVLALIMAITIIISNLLLRTRIPPRAPGPFVELSAFRELPYTFYAMGSFLFFWGVYFSFFYLSDYALYIGLSRGTAFNLIIIQNGVGLFGRLIPNFIADRYTGCLNALIPFCFMASCMLLVWIAIGSYSGLLAFACVYGFFAAGIQSLFPATMASLTTDLSKSGVRMGMIFTIISFATLTGSPIGGALIQMDEGQYTKAQIFAGLVVMSSTVLIVLARIGKTGLVLMAKA